MAGMKLSIDSELADEFKKMKTEMGNPKGWLQVRVDLDKLVCKLTDSGDQSDDAFASLKGTLPEYEHAFYIFAAPKEKGKFVLMHWGPDGAKVKQRMIYSSGRQNMKDHLGSASFVSDYFVSLPTEVSLESYTKSRTVDPNVELRSFEEIERDEANQETAPTVTKSAVMTQMPVSCTEEVDGHMTDFAAGKIGTILFSLAEKQQKISSVSGGADYAEMLKMLQLDKASYVLHRYEHENREGQKSSAVIFVYFCPDKADRRSKFTYSTCKQSVLDLIASKEIEISNRYEFVDTADMTAQYLMDDMYPVKVEKEVMEKPRAAGRKGKRRGGKAALKNLI